MIRRAIVLASAAFAVTTPVASAQQFACALGYTSALASAGTAMTEEERAENERTMDASGMRAGIVLALTSCGQRTFLSESPSLLKRRAAGSPWGAEFRRGPGISGALDALGRYDVRRGDQPELRSGQGSESSVPAGIAVIRLDEGTEGEGERGRRRPESPASPCAYFGGASCDGRAERARRTEERGGAGYGSEGNPGSGGVGGSGGTFDEFAGGGTGSNGVEVGGGTGASGPGETGSEVDVTVLVGLDPVGQAAEIAPEPATMMLLASGLVGMTLAGRRRKA